MSGCPQHDLACLYYLPCRLPPGPYLAVLVEMSIDWQTLATYPSVLRSATQLSKLFACGHHTGDAGQPLPAAEPLAVWDPPAALEALEALPALKSFVDVVRLHGPGAPGSDSPAESGS